MQKSDDDIEKKTAQWLLKVALEEPTAAFTNQVMSSVYALQQPIRPSRNYYWLLLMILPLGIGGWYFISPKDLKTAWIVVFNWYHGLNNSFAEFFNNLRHISISPMIILCFLAVLSLLLLDDIFILNRNKKIKPDTKY